MASSIPRTALWCCPGKIAPPSVSYPLCRFRDSISRQVDLGSKQSFIFVGHLRPQSLLLRLVGPAKVRFFHTVDCQQRQEKQDPVGPKNESGIARSRKVKSGDGRTFLAVTEGVCIVVAGASYTASLVKKSQQTATVASSPTGPHSFSKLEYLSAWQVPALWAAVVINALVRTMQMRSSSNKTESKWEEKSIKDFTVDQRIGKLEDEVHSVVAIARMLSRHLEKLGVRFRVTRRTLRDPIQEAATLALKTSEVVSALATREDTLEAELRETRRQLQETQQLLVAMQIMGPADGPSSWESFSPAFLSLEHVYCVDQESQEKQLQLLITAVTKTLKSQKAIEEIISKDSAKRLATNKATNTGVSAPGTSEKSVVSVETPQSNLAKTFGGLKEMYMKKVVTPTKKKMIKTQSVEPENPQLKNELFEDNQNGRLRVTPSVEKLEKKIPTFKSDTSFTKEDFWANTPATSAADLSVEHEVVDYLTNIDRTSDAVPRYPDNSQGSSRLDSFFSGRKNINSYQAPMNLSTQDYHNPGFSSLQAQSGDSSSGSGNHMEHTMGFGFSFGNGYGKDKWLASEVAPETASGGTFHGDMNNWSTLSGADSSSGSGSGSPRQSNWSCTSAWDSTSSSVSPPNTSWYSASSMDCLSGSGVPRMGEGITNCVQAGFVDTDFMRDFKDGYISS